MQLAVEAMLENLTKSQQSLEPMRAVLSQQGFFGGSNPNYADFAVAALFTVGALELHVRSTTAFKCVTVSRKLKV